MLAARLSGRAGAARRASATTRQLPARSPAPRRRTRRGACRCPPGPARASTSETIFRPTPAENTNASSRVSRRSTPSSSQQQPAGGRGDSQNRARPTATICRALDERAATCSLRSSVPTISSANSSRRPELSARTRPMRPPRRPAATERTARQIDRQPAHDAGSARARRGPTPRRLRRREVASGSPTMLGGMDHGRESGQ